ncbi:MAG: hypothetical protein PF542_05405 [Nanoarchaeota archaeon]|jgi:hypothetical protein|nr:hypothetical protein [Nanoarchaeota archaeon]
MNKNSSKENGYNICSLLKAVAEKFKDELSPESKVMKILNMELALEHWPEKQRDKYKDCEIWIPVEGSGQLAAPSQTLYQLEIGLVVSELIAEDSGYSYQTYPTSGCKILT